MQRTGKLPVPLAQYPESHRWSSSCRDGGGHLWMAPEGALPCGTANRGPLFTAQPDIAIWDAWHPPMCPPKVLTVSGPALLAGHQSMAQGYPQRHQKFGWGVRDRAEPFLVGYFQGEEAMVPRDGPSYRGVSHRLGGWFFRWGPLPWRCFNPGHFSWKWCHLASPLPILRHGIWLPRTPMRDCFRDAGTHHSPTTQVGALGVAGPGSAVPHTLACCTPAVVLAG